MTRSCNTSAVTIRALADLEVVGEPTRLMPSFLNGIKSMPCTV